MIDAGGVHDAGAVAEAVEVVHRGRHVERVVIERLGEHLLVVVAADHGHVAQRGAGLDAHGAQRRDDAAAHGITEREVRDLGREDVADVLLQQLIRGRHPDVHRQAELADGRRGALAERRVRLVADDDAVGGRLDRACVLDEPGVGLDRHRGQRGHAPALLDRRHDPGPVAVLGQIARELVDEQAAMGQDQHPDAAAGLDEPGCCDGLARGGRMLEAIAPAGAGIGRRRGRLVVILGLVVLALEAVVAVLCLVLPAHAGVGTVVLVLVFPALGVRKQRGEHACERVHLVRAQRQLGGEVRLRLDEHALEPEHEPETPAPIGARTLLAGRHLDLRSVQRRTPCGSRGERHGDVLALVQQRLATPLAGGGCRSLDGWVLVQGLRSSETGLPRMRALLESETVARSRVLRPAVPIRRPTLSPGWTARASVVRHTSRALASQCGLGREP